MEKKCSGCLYYLRGDSQLGSCECRIDDKPILSDNCNCEWWKSMEKTEDEIIESRIVNKSW